MRVPATTGLPTITAGSWMIRGCLVFLSAIVATSFPETNLSRMSFYFTRIGQGFLVFPPAELQPLRKRGLGNRPESEPLEKRLVLRHVKQRVANGRDNR